MPASHASSSSATTSVAERSSFIRGVSFQYEQVWHFELHPNDTAWARKNGRRVTNRDRTTERNAPA